MKSKTPFLIFFTAFFLLAACKKDKAETPPPDPIASYPFDDDYVMNSVSSLLNGEVVGSIFATVDSFLVPYRCFKFLEAGYVKVKDSDLLNFAGNQFTLAAWIRPTKESVAYVIIKHDEDKGHSPYSLDIHPGYVRSFIRSENDQFMVQGKSPILKGVWQHVAVTFSGDKLTVYYNGNSDGSVAVDRPLTIKKGDLAIGAAIEYYPAAAFQGSIDNVKIYDKALTAAQMKNLYMHYND